MYVTSKTPKNAFFQYSKSVSMATGCDIKKIFNKFLLLGQTQPYVQILSKSETCRAMRPS